MLKGVLRYLGLDAESKRVREEAERKVRLADSTLDQLQARLDESSRVTIRGRAELDQIIRESETGDKRSRAVRG